MGILVTGASGFVGRHLVASLRREDKSVTVLTRGADASAAENVFDGPADLAALADWPAWPVGIEGVVHLAALNPGRGELTDEAALRRANVEGTRALARRVAREGVRRMIFVSTANVHVGGPGAVRESDAIAPQSAYARSKAEAERAFWQAIDGSGTEGCVLRPAPVFGTGGRGNVASLVKLARLPVPLPIGGLGGRRSLVSVDSLSDVIRRCLDAPGAAGETFLVADEGPVSPGEIVAALRRGWGGSERLVTLPLFLRGMLSRTLGSRSPLSGFTLDTSRLSARTGWVSGTSSAARLEEMAKAGALRPSHMAADSVARVPADSGS